MRSVILFGCNLIAIAIMQANGFEEVVISDSFAKIFALLILVSIIMDIFDFLRGKTK